MSSPLEALRTALQHHQAGRLQEAEAIYRQILQVEPNHPDALHLVGVIAHHDGRHQIAIDCICQAIALSPNAPEYHNNLGEAYRALGKSEEAAACYRRALALKPDFAEACYSLGLLLLRAELLRLFFKRIRLVYLDRRSPRGMMNLPSV